MARTKKVVEKTLEEPIVSSRSILPPCDIGWTAYIPYWDADEKGNIIYNYDTYRVVGLGGCCDVWFCIVEDENGRRSRGFEPNVEIFFTEKDVTKTLNKIKRLEDKKKLAKWKKEDWFNGK